MKAREKSLRYLRAALAVATGLAAGLGGGCAGPAAPGGQALPVPPKTSELPAAAAESLRIQEVLNRWIAAQGGAQRLGKLKSVQCLVGATEGTNRNFFRTAETADGRYRYDIVGSGLVASGGYDGKCGWQDNGAWGAGVFPQRRGDPAWSQWCLHALDLATVFSKRQRLPDETLDGTPCAVLDLADEGRRHERWYFDLANGMLRREIKDFGRGPMQCAFDFSDYRTVSGISIPFAVTLHREDGSTSEYAFVRVELNESLERVSFSPSPEVAARADRIDAVLRRGLAAGGWLGSELHPSLLVHAKVTTPTTGIETQLTVYRRLPDRVLVEKQGAGLGRDVCGYNGTVGWENGEVTGYHIMKDAELSDLVTMSWLGCDPYLRERFPIRNWIGETAVDGKPAVAVVLRTLTGVGGRFYFDGDDGKLLRVEMDENLAAHVRAVRIDYSDYRKVGISSLPFRVTYNSAGIETTVTCSSAETDVAMPDTLFDPRTDVD